MQTRTGGVDTPIVINRYILTDDEVLFLPYVADNVLCALDLQKFEVRVVDVLPADAVTPAWERVRYSGIARIGTRLYFSPLYDDFLLGYDIESREVERILIPAPLPRKGKVKYNPIYRFAKCISCENHVFLMPLTYPGIVVYDCVRKSITVVNDWIDEYENCCDIDETAPYYFAGCDAIFKDECLYLPFFSANAVARVDLTSFRCTVIPFESKKSNSDVKHGFVSAVAVDDSFYLLSKTGDKIFKWATVGGICDTYHVPAELVASGIGLFGVAGFSDGKNVYFLANLSDRSLKLDMISGMVTEFDECRDFQTVENDVGYWEFTFHWPVVFGDSVLLQCGKSNRLIRFEFDSRPLEMIKRLIVSDEDMTIINRVIDAKFKSGADGISGENPVTSLGKFMAHIILGNVIAASNKATGDAGMDIYEFVKGKVSEV
jgi:hypothetical protein